MNKPHLDGNGSYTMLEFVIILGNVMRRDTHKLTIGEWAYPQQYWAPTQTNIIEAFGLLSSETERERPGNQGA